MNPTTALILGLELTRMGAGDDGPGTLSGSLEAIQSGGWTLPAYAGPALQPYVGLRAGRWSAALAPAAAWTRQTARAADGRDAVLRVVQWRVELRLRYDPGPWFVGLDGAFSDGGATLEGAEIAAGTPRGEIGPTAGLRARLADHLDLVPRLRWPVLVDADAISHGPAGGLAVEWRR